MEEDDTAGTLDEETDSARETVTEEATDEEDATLASLEAGAAGRGAAGVGLGFEEEMLEEMVITGASLETDEEDSSELSDESLETSVAVMIIF